MAPVAPAEKRPSARALRHARVTGAIHPLLPAKTFRPNAAVTDGFITSKRDKKLMRHSSFLSRVASSSSSRVAKPKRRRPGNKLKTDMGGLADALPELDEEDEGEKGGKVRQRSLKSKKGALKRKERVVKGEMERFGASMARMAGIPEGQAEASQGVAEEKSTDAAPAPATSNRWAALRGYISSTMEQNPAFAGQK